jgi:hypothetical protein
MVAFVRNKGFSQVLGAAEDSIKGHESYMNGFRKNSDTHFVSNHKVDDDDKEVAIHHLFYHLSA